MWLYLFKLLKADIRASHEMFITKGGPHRIPTGLCNFEKTPSSL